VQGVACRINPVHFRSSNRDGTVCRMLFHQIIESISGCFPFSPSRQSTVHRTYLCLRSACICREGTPRIPSVANAFSSANESREVCCCLPLPFAAPVPPTTRLAAPQPPVTFCNQMIEHWCTIEGHTRFLCSQSHQRKPFMVCRSKFITRSPITSSDATLRTSLSRRCAISGSPYIR
jgi:hypothetical protein